MSTRIFRENLLLNRLHVIEALYKVFRDFSANNDEVFELDFQFENEVPLLPEVIPTGGKNFYDDGII